MRTSRLLALGLIAPLLFTACDTATEPAPEDPNAGPPLEAPAALVGGTSAADWLDQRVGGSDYDGLQPGVLRLLTGADLPSFIERVYGPERAGHGLHQRTAPVPVRVVDHSVGEDVEIPEEVLRRFRPSGFTELSGQASDASAPAGAGNLYTSSGTISSATSDRDPVLDESADASYSSSLSSLYWGGGSAIDGNDPDWFIDMYSWTEASAPVDYLDVIGTSVIDNWPKAQVADYGFQIDYAAVSVLYDPYYDKPDHNNSFLMEQFGDHIVSDADYPPFPSGHPTFGTSCSSTHLCHRFYSYA